MNTITFEDVDGRTLLTNLVQAPSKEVRDAIIDSGMEAGLQDALDLLEEVAASRRASAGGDGFSQTETCDVLSLVNGSRFQPPQRSRRLIPASSAIRSSSAARRSGTGSSFARAVRRRP